MNKIIEITKNYYDSVTEKEWTRLIRQPYSKLELDTTMFFLRKHLPKKGLILDAGAGPGRYTIELAKLGYDVVLLDLSKGNVELAKLKVKEAKQEKKVKGFYQGTITDLKRFKDNSFDSVICLGGALSHIPSKKERKKTVNELIRIAKKGSPIFVSVMGRLSIINLSLLVQNEEIEKNHFLDYAITGDDYCWFGNNKFAHYFLLDELKKLFDSKKAKLITQVGLEGLASPQPNLINELSKNKKAWNNWIKTHYNYCQNPSVAEISNHFMVIYRKI